MRMFNLFDFKEKIRIMDIGASALTETPIYKALIEKKIAQLTAFDGDERQIKQIKETYGSDFVKVFNHFLFDGKKHKVYFCDPVSGMTSIFKPKTNALNFFNGFSEFGKVEHIEEIQTMRLDDVDNLEAPDFLKMDVQGAELGIIKNGAEVLKHCLAMQLEVSYFALYEDQPSFGEVDVYLRKIGFVPHRFLQVKRWSIAPTIFNNNFRVPGNQLLESDIIYVRDPLKLNALTEIQLKKLVILSHFSFKSYDFCARLIIELERRGIFEPNSHQQYLKNIKDFN